MKVHTNMWSFRKYLAFCGFVGLNSHHAPPPPRKSSAIAALVDWEFSQAKFSGEDIFD